MDLIPSNNTLLWSKLSHLEASNFPQSMLFLGQNVAHTFNLTQQLIKRLLCSSEHKGCDVCRSCNFLEQNKHPDVSVITQEKLNSAIKIDQIRDIQTNIYQTPLCATHRIIIIYPANELNRAAANALLKILEEPPKHAIFILLAEHLNTLPATITSRCQRYHVPESKIIADADTPGYLSLGKHYPEDSPRGLLFKQQQEIIDKLCDLSERKISVCQLASTWGNHAIHDWLWFFQLFTASVVQHQLLPEEPIFFDVRVQQLTEAYSPVHFFKQLDIIQELTKKINQDIPLNPTLALESLLMGYVK